LDLKIICFKFVGQVIAYKQKLAKESLKIHKVLQTTKK